ncbi:MAG TPA: cupin domain-containing protein [Polyangia bacterium]
MSVSVQRFDVRRFADDKMQKLNVFETSRFFFDVYCLAPGQAQKPHKHADADKIYAVVEGEVNVRVGDAVATLGPGQAALAPAGIDHGLENRSASNAAVLVFMAPHP